MYTYIYVGSGGLITQSCLTHCDTIECSPSLLCSWDYPGKNTGVIYIYFANKSPSSQSYGFSSSHVWMWEFDQKED